MVLPQMAVAVPRQLSSQARRSLLLRGAAVAAGQVVAMGVLVVSPQLGQAGTGAAAVEVLAGLKLLLEPVL